MICTPILPSTSKTEDERSEGEAEEGRFGNTDGDEEDDDVDNDEDENDDLEDDADEDKEEEVEDEEEEVGIGIISLRIRESDGGKRQPSARWAEMKMVRLFFEQAEHTSRPEKGMNHAMKTKQKTEMNVE